MKKRVLLSLTFGLIAPACIAALSYSLLKSPKSMIAETAYIAWALQLSPGIMIFGPDPKHPYALLIVAALWNVAIFGSIAFAFLSFLRKL